MINSPFASILRCVNNNDRKLNILVGPTHEAYETQLCKTGHNFFSLQHPSFKKWDSKFRQVPNNYQILSGNSVEEQIKADMVFDIVLSQNKFGQFQILSQIAKSFNIPLVSLEHTLPVPQWSNKHRDALKNMRGKFNVFISEMSVPEWGFDMRDPYVRIIHHGIDVNQFNGWQGGDKKILTVCNDYINRRWCCGFDIWQQVTQGLPINPVGSTPGLSQPAKDLDDLILKYKQCSVFFNTSTISPIPTALLEAASVGCPIVTTSTCLIPSFFKNGVNAIVSNDLQQLRLGLIDLLNNPDKARKLGEEARQTILKYFSEDSFVSNWDQILKEAVR